MTKSINQIFQTNVIIGMNRKMFQTVFCNGFSLNIMMWHYLSVRGQDAHNIVKQ